MQEKRCNKCGKLKSLSKFYRDKHRKDGYFGICAKCTQVKEIEYSRGKNPLSYIMYKTQIRNSKHRKHHEPKYTLIEFRNWLFNSDEFHELYYKWVKSNYKKSLRPSIDRLDDYKGYSFCNIRIVTWEDNFLKFNRDVKNGKNNKQSISVFQLNSDGTFVCEYYSIQHAARILSFDPSSIVKCCKGIMKFHKGFMWKYKSDYDKLNK